MVLQKPSPFGFTKWGGMGWLNPTYPDQEVDIDFILRTKLEGVSKTMFFSWSRDHLTETKTTQTWTAPLAPNSAFSPWKSLVGRWNNPVGRNCLVSKVLGVSFREDNLYFEIFESTPHPGCQWHIQVYVGMFHVILVVTSQHSESGARSKWVDEFISFIPQNEPSMLLHIPVPWMVCGRFFSLKITH